MAFKKISDYNEQKYGNLFMLRNDGEYADVVFLYQSVDDVLIADTHYIKSPDYSGYVHYTDKSSPALAKGIKVQTKLFIPLYNISTGKVEFWDRNVRFENVLSSQVFAKTPDPTQFVFRIVRHGMAGDVNTTYEIQLLAKNTIGTYKEILDKFSIKMPDHYETICKSVSNQEMGEMLLSADNNNSFSADTAPDYIPMPRATNAFNNVENVSPTVGVDIPSVNDTPQDLPTMSVGSDNLPTLEDTEVNF